MVDEDFSEEQQDKEDQPLLPTFPKDILQLEHSFGYDCKRFFNLVLIDEDTLLFASGNLLHYLNISTGNVTFRETQFGGGIGFITKNNHPDFTGLLTVGENGHRPTVFIYEYPSHNVRIKLDGAAKTQFTCGSYNSTGELFASQAGYPDFMLTIWRWQTAEVILRSKAFQSNVLHVHFSNYNPIMLVSCGIGHIKFWKMANTFTGLKLQGDVGRFGKKDFSDVYAVYQLPDDKVISGCEWGNILLWEAGLIKFEICRKGRKPCHIKPITRITMENGEVMTVGMDGYVRIWYWETVDLTDPPEDDGFVEIEPIYEFKVGNCEIRGLQKIKPFVNRHYGHYAQDGKGGIWYCDLNVMDIPAKPYKLYATTGGKVITAHASPVSTHLLTLGEDRKMFLYDYAERKCVLEKQFVSTGTDLWWFNKKISSNGMEVVASFEDGIVRHLLLDVKTGNESQIHLVRAFKGHTASITRMTATSATKILVTGGADRALFLYSVANKIDGLLDLQPMGFVKLDAVPNSFSWKVKETADLLIGCKTGEVYECRLPQTIEKGRTLLSYDLTNPEDVKTTKFVSIKSRLRRELKRKIVRKRKEKKRRRKVKDVEKLMSMKPGLQIDMDTSLVDLESEEEEEPPHVPAVPNTVHWLNYTKRNTILVSMGGYDAGYIYELEFGAPEPIHATLIPGGGDCEIPSLLVIEDYTIFGMINGQLRVNRTNPNDFTDLRDYRAFNMHDSIQGEITRIFSSADGNNIFSVGHDGNVFVYNWNGPRVVRALELQSLPAEMATLSPAIDIDDPAHPSLEQEKILAQIQREEDAAGEHDRDVLKRIAELQVKFNAIMRQNSDQKPEAQIPDYDTILDERIVQQIKDELQAELDDVRDEYAYDLEVAQLGKQKLIEYFLKDTDGLPYMVTKIGNPHDCLNTFRHEVLDAKLEQMKSIIAERLRQEARKNSEEDVKTIEAEIIPNVPLDEIKHAAVATTEKFFYGRDPNKIIPRFNRTMLRLLLRYRELRFYDEQRVYNWQKLEKQRPDPDENHPDDDRNIEEAKRTIGDYMLKMSDNYRPDANLTLTQKFIQVVDATERMSRITSQFNEKVAAMRREKTKFFEDIAALRQRLKFIQSYIPKNYHLALTHIPEMDEKVDYPEINLIETCTPSCGIEIADVLYSKKSLDKQDNKSTNQKAAVNTDVSVEVREELQLLHSLRLEDIKEEHCFEELFRLLPESPDQSEMGYFSTDPNDEISPWLFEMRYRFIFSLVEEQVGLVHCIEERIKAKDAEVQELIEMRFAEEFNLELMKCFLITLNHELGIYSDSESIENSLMSKAMESLRLRNQTLTAINDCQRHIEESSNAGNELNDQINTVQLEFMTSCKENRFFKFLHRIFKKKWRPPKVKPSNDESSESSSDDYLPRSADGDLNETLVVRFDESICPTGLDKSIYDMAFSMRSQRHELEQKLKDKQRFNAEQVEHLKSLQKELAHHECNYETEQEEFRIFIKKRQEKLNEVKVAVVLRLDQIQHFYAPDEYRDISKALLFDTTMLHKLRSRADQLTNETKETRRLHCINIVHLRRINTDITYMRRNVTRLQEEIKYATLKKFGMIVDLETLEESVLRKYVFELETSADDEHVRIAKETKKKEVELEGLLKELIDVTKANTEKQYMLAVLQEDLKFLMEALAKQEQNHSRSVQPSRIDYVRDIAKLSAIDRQQKEEIKCLEREICTLRMKAKPLQMYHEASAHDGAKELLPTDDTELCPEVLAVDGFEVRFEPDEFIMDRVQKIVQRIFMQHFGPHTTADNVRKYASKAARYMAQAANTFEGAITDRILDCIVENLQTILPRKYLIHFSVDDLRKLLHEVLAVFDYERSDVNTEDVISGIFGNAIETMGKAEKLPNETQFVVEYMFKELIEVMPLEDCKCDETQRILVDILVKETFVDPRCISVEKLVQTLSDHARDNLLDDISSLPIRRLGENIVRELTMRKQGDLPPLSCKLGSVASVSIQSKQPKVSPDSRRSSVRQNST